MGRGFSRSCPSSFISWLAYGIFTLCGNVQQCAFVTALSDDILGIPGSHLPFFQFGSLDVSRDVHAISPRGASTIGSRLFYQFGLLVQYYCSNYPCRVNVLCSTSLSSKTSRTLGFCMALCGQFTSIAKILVYIVKFMLRPFGSQRA